MVDVDQREEEPLDDEQWPGHLAKSQVTCASVLLLIFVINMLKHRDDYLSGAFLRPVVMLEAQRARPRSVKHEAMVEHRLTPHQYGKHVAPIDDPRGA